MSCRRGASQDILDFCVRELVKLAFSKAVRGALMVGATFDLAANTVFVLQAVEFRSGFGLNRIEFCDQSRPSDCRAFWRSENFLFCIRRGVPTMSSWSVLKWEQVAVRFCSFYTRLANWFRDATFWQRALLFAIVPEHLLPSRNTFRLASAP